jgi:hypothetical protein
LIVEPARPSEQYIEGRVAFHESGAEWYRKHGQTQLADWAREQAALWKAKLEPVKVREPGDGE